MKTPKKAPNEKWLFFMFFPFSFKRGLKITPRITY
jgi:hypothetical protein